MPFIDIFNQQKFTLCLSLRQLLPFPVLGCPLLTDVVAQNDASSSQQHIKTIAQYERLPSVLKKECQE